MLNILKSYKVTTLSLYKQLKSIYYTQESLSLLFVYIILRKMTFQEKRLNLNNIKRIKDA